MLVLPIKKIWLDMILSKEKKEEYRDKSPYYMARFKSIFDMFPNSYIPTGLDKQRIILRNGYSRKSPSCIITASLDIKTGRPEWGAEEGKEYYVLRIYNVESVS